MFISCVSLVTEHGIVRFGFYMKLITFIIQLTTPKSKTVVCITDIYICIYTGNLIGSFS
jgi:hypothetical protein